MLLPVTLNLFKKFQHVDVRVKSAVAARASDNPRVLGTKVSAPVSLAVGALWQFEILCRRLFVVVFCYCCC
jgi:hypothetical protein